MDFDTTIKMNIYETIAHTTHPPTTMEVAQATGASLSEVKAAFARLYQKRLLVPEPGDPSRIRMAPPFSGIVTPFKVTVQGNIYYANCAWDALGIPAALQRDGEVETVDAWTGEPIIMRVRGGQPVPELCVIHFAVPAAKWWADIVYT